MELASLLRPLGLLAGPAALVALLLFAVGIVTVGEGGLDASPLTLASFALQLVALLAIGAAAFAALSRCREAGRGVAGTAVAVVGTVLVAGGAWAALFVRTTLAVEAPEILERDLAGVEVGYVASYVVFTLGWVATGVALLRARLVPASLGVLTVVGGVLAFVPAPGAFRLLVIGITASLLASRLAAPASRDHGARTISGGRSVVAAP